MYKSNQKIQDAYIRLKNEAVYGVYGKRYIPKKDDGEIDNSIDFPNLEDPTDYVTHIPLEQEEIEEAETPEDEKMEKKPEEMETDTDTDMEQSPDEAMDSLPDTGMDPGMGEDPTQMGGMPGEEPKEELTQNQLGRLYELKKIYSRLSSVEAFLSRTTDENILEIRKMVSSSIDLFELVVSNFEQYKEKIDEIIVTYYEFLKVVYESIRNNFKRISNQ